jgi:hypothetical protein
MSCCRLAGQAAADDADCQKLGPLTALTKRASTTSATSGSISPAAAAAAVDH